MFFDLFSMRRLQNPIRTETVEWYENVLMNRQNCIENASHCTWLKICNRVAEDIAYIHALYSPLKCVQRVSFLVLFFLLCTRYCMQWTEGIYCNVRTLLVHYVSKNKKESPRCTRGYFLYTCIILQHERRFPKWFCGIHSENYGTSNLTPTFPYSP